MADNYDVNAVTFAADDVAGVLVPRVKIQHGVDGEAVDASSDNPMPVQEAAPFFWRVGFAEVGAGLQGLAATELTLLQTGPGMTVSQAGGNLVIGTGTTVNSETVLRSNMTFRGSMLSRYQAILSQRIANQTFRFELADLIGAGLAYTINSATSVTVTFPTANPFTAANVGQSLRLSILSSVGIPGRYAIASVSGLTVTFTVAGWPASGSGVLTLYGHNWLASEYTGTTATNSTFDCQRRGWSSGNTTTTINTTASPGHVAQIAFDVLSASLGDALAASSTGYQWASRASRIANVPDEDVDMYFFLVVQNGSTAPASTTTLTVGFVQVEDQMRNKVRITSSDPVGSHPAPVQIMGGTTAVTGTVTANIGTGSIAAGTNAIGDVGAQYRANATGGATPHHIVSAATTNAAVVKASAGRVVGWGLVNTTASYQYVKLHNSTTAPTAGAGVVMTIAIPPNGVNNSSPSFAGIGFGTGIGRTIVTGSADADATATTLGAVVGDIYFA